MAETAANQGGLGGQSVSPLNGARDTRLVERAIRQRWNIPAALRDQLPVELGKIVTSKRASHRNKIAAARALVAADAENLEQERRDLGLPPPGQVVVSIEVVQPHADREPAAEVVDGDNPGRPAATALPSGAVEGVAV